MKGKKSRERRKMSRYLLKELLTPYKDGKLDSIEKFDAIIEKLKFTTKEDRVRLLAECEDNAFDRESGMVHVLELLISFAAGGYVAGTTSEPGRFVLLALLILLLTLMICGRIYASRYTYLRTILENYPDTIEAFEWQDENIEICHRRKVEKN